MKKKDLEIKDRKRLPYVAPECAVIHVEAENILQTSVHMESSTSTEEQWNSETETEGGTIWLQ